MHRTLEALSRLYRNRLLQANDHPFCSIVQALQDFRTLLSLQTNKITKFDDLFNKQLTNMCRNLHLFFSFVNFGTHSGQGVATFQAKCDKFGNILQKQIKTFPIKPHPQPSSDKPAETAAVWTDSTGVGRARRSLELGLVERQSSRCRCFFHIFLANDAVPLALRAPGHQTGMSCVHL